MKRLYLFSFLFVLFNFLSSCNGHTKPKTQNVVTNSGRVGGECEEGYCDIMYLGMPKTIKPVVFE